MKEGIKLVTAEIFNSCNVKKTIICINEDDISQDRGSQFQTLCNEFFQLFGGMQNINIDKFQKSLIFIVKPSELKVYSKKEKKIF